VALEKSNEELVNFANMVAHDVRAPLRSINSFTTLLERDLKNCSKPYNPEFLEFIKQAVSNLDELTNDLLDYAKSDDNSVEDERLSLNQTMKMVLLNLTDTINTTKAEIVLPNSDFFVKGKKLQLIQLFQNLIGNGLKYQSGQETPKVEIQAEGVENKIRISVIDNGIGISQGNLKKIFEPFKRLHNSNEYKGSGIGLATCKKIIDRLGSEFYVSSELGVGSTFTFDLPMYTDNSLHNN